MGARPTRAREWGATQVARFFQPGNAMDAAVAGDAAGAVPVVAKLAP